jgi:bifunctional DNA-binding transcriptional regulator/antitoxin component of YhaV-PrlF toxin-antitoxin module
MTTTELPTVLTLRDRRQITLPAEACAAMRLQIGDTLYATLEGDRVILRSRRARGLDALREIQRAFQESGISEEELLEEGRRVREELVREQYGAE